jgi:glycosyltransferase involved in cell wall biosynthesis
MMNDNKQLSVIVPVFNEADYISQTIKSLNAILQKMDIEYEIVVVDDGSTDGSLEKIPELKNLIVLKHRRNKGYGAAIKSGLLTAKYENICITDADGTYPLEMIPKLFSETEDSDMVVGSRTGKNVQYSWLRHIPKFFLRHYVNFITNTKVPDINSGLRIFKRSKALRFFKLYPDGFSLTTTITIAFITNGYSISFHPISYGKRVGHSKIQPIRDTLRFFQLITRLGMYFAPLKVLLPFILGLGMLFIVSFGYDILYLRDITDKSVLLLLFTLNTTFFALLADMIHKSGKIN